MREKLIWLQAFFLFHNIVVMHNSDNFDDLFEDDRTIPYGDQNIASTMGSVRRQLFFKTRGTAIAIGGLIFAVLVLASVIFFSYTSEHAAQTIPMIQADARPYRVMPDDPGGMAIPHRDSTVFSSLRSKQIDSDETIENLLADDTGREEALPRSQLFAGLNTEEDLNGIDPAAGTEDLLNEGVSEADTMFGAAVEEARKQESEFMAQKQAVNETSSKDVAAAIAKDRQKMESAKVELKPIPKPQMASPKATDPKAEDKPQQMAALTQTPKADPMKAIERSGTHYVQVGAVKSAAAAEKGWGAYQGEYGAALSGADHRVQRADLGEKGIYYRIQAGPFSKSKAADVCASIKAQKPAGCLVVAK